MFEELMEKGETWTNEEDHEIMSRSRIEDIGVLMEYGPEGYEEIMGDKPLTRASRRYWDWEGDDRDISTYGF